MLDYFKINLPETDIDGIRQKLLKILSKHHPDKTGGTFKSKSQKMKYEEVTNAISELNTPIEVNKNLIITDKLHDLIVKVSNESTLNSEVKRQSEVRQLKLDLKENIKSISFPFKITSAGIGAFALGILTFGKSLKEIPFLSPLTNIVYLDLILLIFLIMSAALFLYAFIFEKKEESEKEWLLSEYAKKDILRLTILQSEKNAEFKYTFSFNDFLSNVSFNSAIPVDFYQSNGFLNSKFSRRKKPKLSIALLEQIAKLHLSDLESRGIIKKSNTKSFEIIYELDKDFERELRVY
ncbi:J domain-containing protein [Leptospira meyeri]|uniref:J domain-containing protein n=1 Tax=Leptospira meyeri TaxID=29508 RepID=UPI00223D5F18|nr:J domain-containing protein [Leptospira meyeri]MCW7490852.1 J domain-containing protein [Leptospira meyeri]